MERALFLLFLSCLSAAEQQFRKEELKFLRTWTSPRVHVGKHLKGSGIMVATPCLPLRSSTGSQTLPHTPPLDSSL